MPWWLEASTPAIMIGVLVVCVVLLVLMRDRRHADARIFSRWVSCPREHRATMVEISERVETGMTIRTVRSCPLRQPGEWCSEMCVMQLTSPEVRAAS